MSTYAIRAVKVAKQFNCTPAQVKRQYARNAASLLRMARQARGGTQNGFTFEQLLQHAEYFQRASLCA